MPLDCELLGAVYWVCSPHKFTNPLAHCWDTALCNTPKCSILQASRLWATQSTIPTNSKSLPCWDTALCCTLHLIIHSSPLFLPNMHPWRTTLCIQSVRWRSYCLYSSQSLTGLDDCWTCVWKHINGRDLPIPHPSVKAICSGKAASTNRDPLIQKYPNGELNQKERVMT